MERGYLDLMLINNLSLHTRMFSIKTVTNRIRATTARVQAIKDTPHILIK